MDFLLISAPVANFGQATSGLSVLTSYLRAQGWDAQQWDLAIDAFHHFHSPDYLRERLEVLRRNDCEPKLLERSEQVVRDIERAKASLQQRGVEREPETMRFAFQTIHDAGVLITAASLGAYEHDFRHFGIPDAFRNYTSLDEALGDPEQNPYLEYLAEHALPRIEAQRPRAIGISMTYFSQVVPGFTLLRLIRERLPEIPVVLGGAYLTAVEGQVPAIPPRVVPADAIILHDGEQALTAWIAHTLEGQGSLEAVPNCYLPQGEGFTRVGERSLIHTDLDTLPVPMWTLDGLQLDRYLVPQYPIPLPLSRGCYWGRCAFCNISCQTVATYRTRPVAKAIADMRAAIAETGSNWFDFPVDSYRPAELHELALAIIDAGLEVEWGAEVLLDAGFKDEVIADLAKSGCRTLRFGLESACIETLKAMIKPTRPKHAKRILTTCKANGIQTAVMLIAGFPTETQSQLMRTYDWLIENADVIDFLTIHQYSLVPGSPMGQDPDKWGLYVLPQEAVLWTSMPFVNTNPVSMKNDDLPRVVDAMREGLKPHFTDLGELWTVAIGGWMTFPAACGVRRDLVHPISGG
ncbi:MAG: B12-binding domain-containing radical SAM protein [Planctomycetes bacterium]|nr:B12-binding domain-containing radical SAM protein [Planctomycetota bacterium]